jgi:long-subunit fatty acid transport protein
MRQLLVGCLLLAPCLARANTFDTFGNDPRGLALGGAQTADSNDFTSAYYNPSRLALLSKINTGVSFTYYQPSVTVTPADSTAPVTSVTPQGASSYALGFVYPFAGKLRDKVAIGLNLSMPTRNLLTVQAVDPNKPAWYLYQSTPDRIQTFIGVGIRPIDMISIGVGAQVLADFNGQTQFNVDLFNKAFVQRDLTNTLSTRMAPNAGLTFIPLKQVHIGFAWRGAMELDYALPNNIDLGDLGTLVLNIKGVTFYTPNEFNLGAHVEVIPGLTLMADLEYALWSKAPNPAVTIQVAFNGPLEKGLGLDQALALNTTDQNPGFSDIFIPRFGAEYHIGEHLIARGGYYYKPTFVPLQNGTTNILDCSGHVLSAGLSVLFADPLEILSDPVEIAIAGQHAFLDDRTAQKSVENPVPSYTYGGSTTVVNASVRYNF